MSSIDYPEIFALWTFSKDPAVRMVAGNMDILYHLIKYLEPMQNYNEVVREFKDPRFHKGAMRVCKQQNSSKAVHPGRYYVRVIHPQAVSWPYRMNKPVDKDFDIYGMKLNTSNHQLSHVHSLRNYQHEDLDKLLTEFGYTRFKSKTKNQKLHMLIKHTS